MPRDLAIYSVGDPEGIEIVPIDVSREDIKKIYDQCLLIHACKEIEVHPETSRCKNLTIPESGCTYRFNVRGEVKRVCLCHLQFNQL